MLIGIFHVTLQKSFETTSRLNHRVTHNADRYVAKPVRTQFNTVQMSVLLAGYTCFLKISFLDMSTILFNKHRPDF
jgi:hypothetical protein